MNTKVKFEDLGLIDYKEAWDYQTKLFDEIMTTKQQNSKVTTNDSPLERGRKGKCFLRTTNNE